MRNAKLDVGCSSTHVPPNAMVKYIAKNVLRKQGHAYVSETHTCH